MDLNAMTFGIEIECGIPAEALDRLGWTVGAYHRGAEMAGFPGWKLMSDCSVHVRYPLVPGEVVSPILRGAEGLAEAARMIAKLVEIGARVNRSTGFHVHVGFTGSAQQLRRLICFVAYHEKALYATTGTRSREHNHFCSSIKAAFRSLAELRSLSDIANRHQSRYHVLNLQNLATGARQTVEFRVFAGTLNATKIAAYIQLCLGIVQKACDTSAPLPWDAPASKRQARERIGDGFLAVRRLINHLGWHANGDRKAFGVFDRDTLPRLNAKLRELAVKYDGPIAETEAHPHDADVDSGATGPDEMPF